MSMPPPPPPPGSPPPPPGMPPPPPSGFGSGAPVFGGATSMMQQPAAGLAKAMVALYWVATAATAGLGASMVRRGGLVTDFIKGTASFDDADSADNQVAAIFLLLLVVMLAAAIVTSLWSRRVVSNAQIAGTPGLRPGLAAGGWFIPILWFVVPFQQLRSAGKGGDRDVASIAVWQAAFVVGVILMGVSRSMVRNDALSLENVGSRFTNQGFVMGGAAVAFFVATLFAGRTTKAFESAV